MKINIKLLSDHAKIPHYAHIGDAGADVFASEYTEIPANGVAAVPTGVAMEIPEDYVGYINPRSGLALKGLTVMNSPGTIDSGYRGEIKVIMANHTGDLISIPVGTKIAQMVFHKFHTAWFEPVDELTETSRGHGGFGSTGI
jgi:dUTP pyrophosphatase